MQKPFQHLARFLERCSLFFVAAVVFLIPFFTAPGFLFSLDKTKQFLFIFCISAAVIAFCGYAVITRSTWSLRHPAMIAAVVFVGIVLLSTVTGVWPYASLFGLTGSPHTSFASVLGFFLFFLLVVLFAQRGQAALRLLFFALLGGYIALFAALAHVFSWELIPWGMVVPDNTLLSRFANTVGSIEQFAVYCLFLAHISLFALLHVKHTPAKPISAGVLRIFLLVLLLGAYLFILLSPVLFARVALLAVLFAASIYAIVTAKRSYTKWLLLPMLLCALTLVSFFVTPPFSYTHGEELMRLDAASSQSVVAKAVLARPIVGFGPGTFLFSFYRFFPSHLNATPAWNLSFSHARSDLFALVNDVGVAGSVAWLVFVISLLVYALRAHTATRGEVRVLQAGVLGGWLLLVIFKFLIPFSFVLELLFWFSSALLVAFFNHRSTREQNSSSALPTVMALLAAVVVVGAVVSVRALRAEMLYERSVLASTKDSAVVYLNRARLHARYDDRILRALGENLLERLEEGILRGQTSQEVNALAQRAIEVAKEAVALNPRDVRNTFLAANVYAALAPVTDGAATQARSYLEQSLQLRPLSPELYVALGRTFVRNYEELVAKGVKPDAQEARIALSSAESAFREALHLRVSYAAAHGALGQVYAYRGNMQNARLHLERGFNLDPSDVHTGLRLALLYLGAGEHEKAAELLDGLIVQNKQFANALWYRALLYEESGDLAAARRLLEQILVTDPDNATVQNRLTIIGQ